MEKAVLFVCGNEDVRLAFQNVIASYVDYNISYATDGNMAVEMLKTGEFRAVVTELHLEGIDGIKLLSYVKEYYPEIPGIVFTSRLDGARVTYLVNVLGVFKILLWSADMKKELIPAIKEALAESDISKNQKQSMDQLESKASIEKAKLQDVTFLSDHYSNRQEELVKKYFMILRTTEKGMEKKISDAMFRYQGYILSQFCRHAKNCPENFQEVQNLLISEFHKEPDGKLLEIHAEVDDIEIEDLRIQLYNYSWMMILRFYLMRTSYHIILDIRQKDELAYTICMQVQLPTGKWSDMCTDTISRMYTESVESVLERRTQGFGRAVNRDSIEYKFTIQK